MKTYSVAFLGFTSEEDRASIHLIGTIFLYVSFPGFFPIIEFLLPGQKFISTLLSDILTI
jgi:hypothetical protein